MTSNSQSRHTIAFNVHKEFRKLKPSVIFIHSKLGSHTEDIDSDLMIFIHSTFNAGYATKYNELHEPINKSKKYLSTA